MATVHITTNSVQGRALTGATMPVIDSIPLDSVTATSSGTDADIAGIVGVVGCFWEVVVTGGNVYVAFGTNPDAGVDPGRHLVLDGERFNAVCLATGEEISIKDA